MRSRVVCIVAFVATLLLGLASRHDSLKLTQVFGKYPGDALWALMIFFAWTAIRPRTTTSRLAAFAGATCAFVEFAKLYQAPWIVDLRHTTAGHLVLGHVFSWQNLVAYAVGVSAGTMIDAKVLTRSAPSAPVAASPR